MSGEQHHVVVVGGGFGGLEFTRAMADAPVRITLIDQRNHHLFQPLLYQVATTSLGTSEIAWPIRHLLRREQEVTTLLATVTGVDAKLKCIVLDDGTSIAYDTLVLATGARHSYFGHDEWEEFAPGLKTLEDATTIRRRILLAFENAERDLDEDERQALLTFVIVGGGPTGVELAGTIAELAKEILPGEFRLIDPAQARVVLIEGGDRVLPAFRPELSEYAKSALERLGVTVKLGHQVTACDAEGVKIGETRLPSRTILWAAGVAASPAAEWLGVAADKAGRVIVGDDLTVPGHPDIFAIGDTALVKRPDGRTVPGIAPAAKQEGRHVAETIKARLGGEWSPRPFLYKHEGDLATIGKRAAVIDFGDLSFRGRIAWWLWGFVHIFFLIGLRNRIFVALSWLWTYTTGSRSARLITQGPQPR
ncbi:NAD(P)/FAD-dependent oxidoreductase [Pseudaminobacter sp. 19-2017]|uniref:NADH:ubiquinone reductase (non-electrogenic) n=1 Tax=Pseudaminobacter soli (ex Zhang et al. 2022) TaxID=2831468 RepID=A0A942I6Q9_9HYPH|nr:NAD(P)/FAD-dependent oxidoreductase [Pseudaminobacter soli]MBS3647570.1 NAD(P)/FAD-dependent oxidoreductase [Pseudaminobacter soli]